mgnify:CR=1 FL=1
MAAFVQAVWDKPDAFAPRAPIVVGIAAPAVGMSASVLCLGRCGGPSGRRTRGDRRAPGPSAVRQFLKRQVQKKPARGGLRSGRLGSVRPGILINFFRLAEFGPVRHKSAAAFKQVSASICRLCLAFDYVR